MELISGSTAERQSCRIAALPLQMQVPPRRPVSRAVCFGGSIALHVLIFALVSNRIMSGQHFRESAQPAQMTVYVGLGDSHATLNASLPTQAPALPILQSEAHLSKPGSGALGPPIPKANPAELAHDVRDTVRSTFLPSSTMDRVAVPVSAPDINMLTGVHGSGLPIRLRLFVDAQGAVKDIHVMKASDMDADAVEQIKKMFYATKFIPGRREGRDTASYLDIELTQSEVTGVSLMLKH